MSEPLSQRYDGLLQGRYDCVDRVMLNGYYGLGHSAGGFRLWWQRLQGADAALDRNQLMRMAGHFSRRLRAYAQAHRIPMVHCPAGTDQHQLAEEYRSKTKLQQGVFAILVGRAPAPVWDVSGKGHLEWKRPMPFVNHYSFHILDAEWGHVTIRLSGHPPFPAQIMLNGHEYVACQAQKAGLKFSKEENCFTSIVDVAGLAQIADTLSGPLAIGRLRQVCERWIYSSCLCFALGQEEQKQSGFQYQYSIYQVEYSRNLLFRAGREMEEVFQALLDRSRAPMDVKKIKTILGHKRGPARRGPRKKRSAWEVTVERPVYDLTVFKVRCGLFTLKIYTKGERVLRVETIAHNVKRLRCGYSLGKFSEVVRQLQGILERFMEVLSCMDQCYVGATMLEQLPVATQVGHTRVGGIDVNRPRMRSVVQAVLALACHRDGFTISQLAEQVRQGGGHGAVDYSSRQAAYDLKKLRGKQIVHRREKTRRYIAVGDGLRVMTALLVLRDKVLQPLLAAAQPLAPSHGAQNPAPIDRHYEAIRMEMQGVFQHLGIAA
jgi:hypothetical protein